MNLHKCADSPEPSLLVFTKYLRTSRFRPKYIPIVLSDKSCVLRRLFPIFYQHLNKLYVLAQMINEVLLCFR